MKEGLGRLTRNDQRLSLECVLPSQIRVQLTAFSRVEMKSITCPHFSQNKELLVPFAKRCGLVNTGHMLSLLRLYSTLM